MMPLLYLVRHAEADTRGRMVGRQDIPLSRMGIEDARRLGERLRPVAFSAAWCSPLRRAVHTAEAILAANQGGLCSAQRLDGLVEISLGGWEGKSKDDVIRQYPEIWSLRGRDPANTAPPGGESFAALSARVLPVFQALCREAAHHEHSLVVAHQAVNRTILAHIQGIPLEHLRDIPQPHCALAVIELSAAGAEARIVKKEPSPPL